MRGQRPRSFLPSSLCLLIHLLTLIFYDLCLEKLGLWEATQVYRKYRLRSSVLRKNLCTNSSTELQVPILQPPWKNCVQRILRTCTLQAIPRFFFSIFPSLVTHQPHRDAVQQGHALPCVECRRQPQAIGDLCLGCNSTIGKSNEPRLRELDLQDPRADSRMPRTPATLPWSLSLF